MTAREQLVRAAQRKAAESAANLSQLFARQSERLAECAAELASRFNAGARLFTLGNGGSACDAEHAAVEFCHPIIAKRPPLPAVSLGQSRAWLTAIGNDEDMALAYARELDLFGQSGDVALALSTSGQSSAVLRALRSARERGLLRVGLTGGDGGDLVELCDYAFVVPSHSIHRIQEAHVVLLHVLWDLVHVARGEEDVL